MSAYVEAETNFSDEECLIEALGLMKPNWVGKVESHKEPQSLYGYRGKARDERAHLIIRRENVGSASNDVGFQKENGRYKALISNYDNSYLGRNFLGKLSQTYAELKVVKNCKRKGYRVKKEVQKDGSVKLIATRYA